MKKICAVYRSQAASSLCEMAFEWMDAGEYELAKEILRLCARLGSYEALENLRDHYRDKGWLIHSAYYGFRLKLTYKRTGEENYND